MKPSLGALVSVALNVILSLWLINNYFYDEPFRNYVNITFGQIYPFLVLTLGLGGGSGLGYLLLKRRHPQQSAAAKLQKSKLLRQGTLPSSTSATASQSRGLGSIASATQPARHTAYAVPPLSRGSSPSSQRGAPSISWSTSARPASPGSVLPQRSETGSVGPSQTSTPTSSQTLKAEQAKPVPPTGLQGYRTDQSQFPVPRISTEPDRGLSQPPRWRTEPPPAPERKVEPGAPYPKPGLEVSTGNDRLSTGQSIGPGTQQPPMFQGSKWQSPESVGKPAQWVDPVPKQGYTPPQKWLPPTGSGSGSQPAPPGGIPARQGPLPPQRSPFAQPQPPPRPLAYPGAMRPPEGRPPGGPGPFRPDQPRPFQGGIPPPRPPLPGQRPGPQQWVPPGTGNRQPPPRGSQEKFPSIVPGSEPPPSSSSSSESKPASDVPPAGEMDWDTALDTILKTLRKDKLVEK